jgi:excisionase family DNA binding protein
LTSKRNGSDTPELSDDTLRRIAVELAKYLTTEGFEPLPLALSVARTCDALACKNDKVYELIRAGEVDSFLIGRARRITFASIRRYVARQLAAAKPPEPLPWRPEPRRRGRPRKPLPAPLGKRAADARRQAR